MQAQANLSAVSAAQGNHRQASALMASALQGFPSHKADHGQLDPCSLLVHQRTAQMYNLGLQSLRQQQFQVALRCFQVCFPSFSVPMS